jgi:hypothetical protein
VNTTTTTNEDKKEEYGEISKGMINSILLLVVFDAGKILFWLVL